jgi:hypothetical protein
MEIIAFCSEIHKKHINASYGQNVELVNVTPGGTYSNHWPYEVTFSMKIKGVNIMT